MKMFLLICALAALATLMWNIRYSPGYQGVPSAYFDGNRFHNPVFRPSPSFFHFWKWIVTRQPPKWQAIPSQSHFAKPALRVQGEALRLTFVGHATFLIQTQGLNILTDPIWSDRCSPVSFLGPKRVHPPGIAFADLPPIDLVLISHNHYDHLDLPTLRHLETIHHPLFVVGLGNAPLLKKNGMQRVHELGWWEKHTLLNSIHVWSVSAQHFSGRGPFDYNRTLWMGFIVQMPQKTLYFAGDTGFGPHFEQIQKHFGDIDIALLPIGAFLPRWLMEPVHISPQEAVEAAKVLKAKRSIGMHFGTFQLGDDGQREPIIRLQQALKEHPQPPAFDFLKPGEWIDF